MLAFRTRVHFFGLEKISLHQVCSQCMVGCDALEPLVRAVAVCTAISDTCYVEVMFVDEGHAQSTGHICFAVGITIIDYLTFSAYAFSHPLLNNDVCGRSGCIRTARDASTRDRRAIARASA